MIGTVVENVKLVSEIGRGSLGTVFMAQHVNVEKTFAVRQLLPQIAQNPQYREHFIKEAKAQFPLKHENLVQFYSIHEQDKDVFLLMEHVEGEKLDKYLESRGALPEDQAISICKDVLEALNVAHSNGITHRDVRPANILITPEGKAKIKDFGLALMLDGTRLTETGEISVSARYVSPEQITGTAKPDRRSDIYSLGVVLYELLMGRPPFTGQNNVEVYEAHVKSPPGAMGGISPELNAVVMKALEKKPGDRFQGCGEFAKQLSVLGGESAPDASAEAGETEGTVSEEAALEAMAVSKPKAKRVRLVRQEEPEPKPGLFQKYPQLKLVAMGVAALVIVAIGGLITLGVLKGKRAKAEFQETLAKVGQEKNLDRKALMLASYLQSHEGGDHAKKARRMLDHLHAQIEERDFDLTMQNAHKWRMEEEYERARGAYTVFLKKHPRGAYAEEIRKKLAETQDKMDERDYRALYTLPKDDYATKVKACKAYLENHPKGKHRSQIEPLLADLGNVYYTYVKRELDACQGKEDWERCVALAGEFTDSMSHDKRAEEINPLLKDFKEKLQWAQELDKIRQSAESKGKDYAAAKKVYEDYLDKQPPAYLKAKIKQEILRLDRKREWESVKAYSRNGGVEMSRRIDRLDRYIQAHPGSWYAAEAEKLLKELKQQKKTAVASAAARRREQEKREWQEINAVIANPGIPIFERIRRMESYVAQNPSGPYEVQAQAKLKAIRAEGEEWVRLNGIEKRLKAQLGPTAGVFVDNGDGTIVDKRTGLTWCLLDSFDALNKCLNFNSAVSYVKGLTAGGHDDWRLPSPRELALIYKSEPFFPSVGSRWYWTSDMLGKGMTARVYIVDSKQDGILKMDHASVRRCGTVRAVRK
jgi:hypothetical protein